MPRRCLLLMLVVSGCAVREALPPRPTETMLYVATDGSDAWSGRLSVPNAEGTDGPFASLARARDEVRRIKQRGLTRPVRVIVRGGVYELTETLRFTPADSGTAPCPIAYEAAQGERVVIRGGRAVTGWRPWKGKILQADLKAQDLGGAVFYQLFYGGRRQVLARDPNVDPKHPRTGGFAYMEARGPRPRQQFVYENGSIPFQEWSDTSQAEIVTVFGRGWNFAIAPIESVDTARRLVTIVFQVRRPFEPENRFFIRNVLAALDRPGEWYLDRTKSVLYFWPPGAKLDGEVVVPLIDHLIELKGTIPYPHGYLHVRYKGTKADFPTPDDAPPLNPVEHITLRGFRFEAARQDALRLVGARRCKIVGCTVTNVGGVGINLGGVANAHREVGNPRPTPATGYAAGVGGGGQNLLFNDPCIECRVVGCDVRAVGSDGIFLYGTANVAENNHVWDSGLYDKDCAAVNAFGERNVVRRNTLHDVPRNAVFLKGTDNVVELNDIRNTLLETCDGGAIRMCQRNLTLRGNVIRFNRILDSVGYGYPRGGGYQASYFSWGVYLDDFTCGTTVFGNIIVRCGRGGVHVHGGSDNLIENNIVVDGGLYQFENNPIRSRPSSGNIVRRNIFAYTGQGNWLYRCGRWLDGSVAWEKNLVACPADRIKVLKGLRNEIAGWDAWLKEGLEKGSVVGVPRFRDPARDDYRLRPDSPASRLGFQKIPVEQIGCYPSPDRVAWRHIGPAGRLWREQPVLRKAPVRPVNEDFELDAVGGAPRRGDVMAARPSAIRVTGKLAAGGKQCLEFVDAPGLPHGWQPRIYYTMKYGERFVRFACDLRLSGKAPPDLMFDFRQYSHAPGREYLSGPMIAVDPKGELTANGRRLLRVPFDQWARIECILPLGHEASGLYDLAVTLRGQEPRHFRLPYHSGLFRQLERVVIMSNSTTRTVFYVDNVFCGPIGKGAH